MSTCNVCRTRKIKCDGAQPRCGSCSRSRRPVECSYEIIPQTPPLESLRKGAACFSCRRKKKKCDALRPFCTACVANGSQSDCKYDGSEFIFTPIQTAETFSHSARGRSTLSPSPEEWKFAFTQSAASNDFNQTRLPHMSPPNANFEDLFFNFRLTFIIHHVQFGLYIPESKHQTILFGDLSGINLHPVFVSLAQLLGCNLHRLRERGSEPTVDYLHQTEKVQLQHCIKSISSMIPESISVISLIAAYEIMAIYYLRIGSPSEGMRWLTQAKQVAETRGVHFVSSYSTHPASTRIEPANDTLERVNVLSQLIFMQITCKSLKLVAPQFNELESQFREELSSAYPAVFENPAVLRTKSALFFMDVAELLSSFNGTQDWSNTAQSLLNALSNHIVALASLITKSDILQDRATSALLRYSTIIGLTSLAEFNRFMSASPLAHVQDFRSACANAVYQVVQVTKALHDDDYCMLDQFIHVCWTNVLNMAAELCGQGLQNAGAGSLKSCIIVLSTARNKIESVFRW